MMEKKLKKQKRKLILRVSVILFAVWIAVSAVYSVIRFNNEKTAAMNNVNYEAQFAIRNINALSGTGASANNLTYCLIESTENLFENNEIKRNLNTELAICEYPNGKTLADTSHKLDVDFGIKTGAESSGIDYGFIDLDRLRNKVTQSQSDEILSFLNTKRTDEKYYELLCTKFYMNFDNEIVPRELQIVLTETENVWYAMDEPVKTFPLEVAVTQKDNFASLNDFLICSEMRRNVIPKDALFEENYAENLIGMFSKEELAYGETEKRLGFGEYVFYSADLFNYNPELVELNTTADNSKTYILRCAECVNVLERCMNDLLTGVSAALLFFLIVAVLLCVLTWRLIKNQFNEEQKRLELTNALAHDIKTPLFVISGYAQSLKENINTEKKEHFADRIIYKTDEANALVHKMLNLGKLESYQVELNLSEFDLYELTSEILSDYINLPNGKSISATRSGENTVTADREPIKTAIENLIDNAVKYSSPDSEIQISVIDKRFCITNECDNLTKSDLKEIIKPYVKNDKSRHQNSNGLGLSIVKSILDLHSAKYDLRLKDERLEVCIDFR